MNIEQSESITNLAKALSKFQGEVGQVEKDSKGFNYDYASMKAILDSVRKPLEKNGLAVIQFPCNNSDGSGLGVITKLVHSSGEWIRSSYVSDITNKPDVGKNCQAHGSLITYYRRYAELAILNLAPSDKEDDDGYNAKEAFKESPKKATPKKAPPQNDLKEELRGLIGHYKIDEKELIKIIGVDFATLKNETRDMKFREYVNAVRKVKKSVLR